MRQVALALALLVATPALGVTYQFATPIAGDSVLVTLELVGVAVGTEVTVSIPPGAGDLLGVFGNVTPESLLSTMGVSDPDDVVTQWQLGPKNKVWKVGAGNVMAPVKTWDWGLQLGFPGGGGGALESASFVLTGVSVAELTGASTQGWVFGVRIQSTDGAEGSAKIGMPVGTPPTGEPPTIVITQPADGAALASSGVAVAGTVSGTAPTVTVNGQTATVTGGTFSTALTLADGAHTLTATATNTAGSATDAITVTVDTAGPLITITAPTAGTLTNQTPVVVTGTVADASLVTSVSINGASFPVSAGAFSGSASLVEGANTITVSAVDALGNPGQATVPVTLDTIPPVVVISTPPDGALTTQAAILVEGSITDASPIDAFAVNGQATALGAGNVFGATLALASGANALTASATDAAGNTGSATVTVTRGVVPAVAIMSPAAGFLTNQASALVTGTAPGAASVSVNGVAAALTGSDWSATVPLTEGANTLVATATNAFGSAQAQAGGTRDSTPPLVTITSPADGSETSEATVFVVGTVADASPIAALAIDGDPITPGSSFNVSAALAEGANTIAVAATDAAGNTGSASTTVTRQTVESLAVTITSPPEGSLVSQERIAVAGTVSPAGASVVVNGIHATVTGESFTAAAVPLDEGPNTLTAIATRSGATASDNTGVTLNLPPEISVTAPLDGAVVRAEATDVEGFVSDPLALVDVNGIPARVDSGGRFVAEDVPLDAGPNDLVARAIDLEGAQASDRAAVVRDDAAGPAVRVVLGFLYNFHPYPAEPDQFLLDPNTRLVTFSSTDEWLAAMAEIGRPASGFLPAADLPVVRGHSDSVWAFVLSEAPEEPSLDFVFPDGHASDYITSDYQGSGPLGELFAHPIFELLAPSQLVSPETLAPSDFEPAYYHLFLLTRPVQQPDGGGTFVPPYSAPLVIRASQAAGSDSITVFWDEQDAFAEVVAPSPAFARVSGASVEASGTALEEHVLAAATYRVLNLSGGAGAIDLGPGEGTLGDGRFRIADAPLGVGENVLFVNVHDGTSWSDGVAVAIERDPSAPDVQLVFPRDGEALTAESASLSLNFGVPLTLVSVNGAPDGRAFPVGLAEDIVSVPLVPGPNPIEVVVDDGSGELPFTFVLYRVATLDPPRITSPAHRSSVNTDTMEVEGVVPLGTPYVEVNGVPGTIDPGGVRFTASIPVPRDLGFYLPGIDVVARPLVVTAVAYPQGTSASIEVTPDFVAPEFRLVLPENGAATLEEAAAYGGWLSEAATVTLTHAGGEQVRTTLRDRAREGEDLLNFFGGIQFHRFDFEPVPVSTGPNTVTLTARDRAGNESQLTLDLERFAAALSLTSPTAPVPALATDLVFDVVAPVTLQGMFVNGRFLPSTRSLSFSVGTGTIANVPLEPGPNALRLVYTQAGGPQQVLNLAVESSSTVLSVVTGRAVDPETGEGIWGALITLDIGGQTILVATAPDGTFRVVVPPGQVAGSVTAIGYASASFGLTLAGGETVDTQVSLAPIGGSTPPPRPEEVELLATVRDAASSAPLQGVTVEALGEGAGAIEVTDGAGLAGLSSIRVGEQTFRFRRRDFLDVFATRQIQPPATGATVSETFDIAWTASDLGTLAIDTNAEGTVLDGLTLRPLAGAQVEARNVVTSQLVGTTATDAQGRFTLAGLPRFATLEITATRPDHAAQTIQVFVVPRGDERLDFHLRASGVGRIEGTITDASTGLPISLASVGLPGAPLRTASEGDGLFVLVNAPAGIYDLTVSHPAYFPATIAGVAVTSDGITSASTSLTPRPKTGGIYGVVRRAAGDLPVPGATIVAASGRSATADAEGKFSLIGLPSGLEELTVSAPGFTTRVKTAVVDADIDAVTPTQRYVELDLSANPLEATADIAIEGGSIELPDGSVRIDFPPLSLSGDARVTLLRRAIPLVDSGDTLAMDPALAIGSDVAALGEEVVIRIESATPGATAPFFVGPILVSGRYSAAAAAALGGREDVAFPAYYDADLGHWTVPRVVPYLHLVDTVNRLSVTGLSMILTETGAPVTAHLVSPDPIQLAGFADLPVIRQVREIVVALAKVVQPLLGIDRVADLRVLNPEFFEDGPDPIPEAKRWDQNARPLFVFHGWDKSNVLFDSAVMTDGAILEGRYGTIMRDLAERTDGVYRPVFATYNTRMGVEALANLVSARVAEQEGGALRGLPSDPDDPATGPLFGSYDSFGFSMGGLIGRAYQRQVNGSPRQIRSMVTMGTPHHGGLPLLRDTLAGNLREQTGFLSRVRIEALLALWSPGTADLLDYDEFNCRFSGAELSGNPTLCRMNRDPLTAPANRLSLIAGTDSVSLTGLFDRFVDTLDEGRFQEVVEEIGDYVLDAQLADVPVGDLVSVGFAATGCARSDGVVCVWSAHARTGPTGGDATVPALANALAKRPSSRFFNHSDGGSAEQKIVEFADEDMIEILTDFYVGQLQELHVVEPTESEPGEVRFAVDVEYNAPHGDITALVAVVYGRYEDPPGQFAWKILAGADEDGEPNSEAAHEIDTNEPNSAGGEVIQLTAETDLPAVDPMDPSTDLNRIHPVLIGIGPSQPTVPLEPPEGSFNLPSPPPEP